MNCVTWHCCHVNWQQTLDIIISASHYLQEVIQPGAEVTSRPRLWSSSSSALLVPVTRRTTLGDQAFAIAGSRAWNTLADFIIDCSSSRTFKQYLKTYLFSLSFSAHNKTLFYDCVKRPSSLCRLQCFKIVYFTLHFGSQQRKTAHSVFFSLFIFNESTIFMPLPLVGSAGGNTFSCHPPDHVCMHLSVKLFLRCHTIMVFIDDFTKLLFLSVVCLGTKVNSLVTGIRRSKVTVSRWKHTELDTSSSNNLVVNVIVYRMLLSLAFLYCALQNDF